MIKPTNESIYFGLAQNFEIDLLWLAGNAKPLRFQEILGRGI